MNRSLAVATLIAAATVVVSCVDEAPVASTPAASSGCPDNTSWDGVRCMATEVACSAGKKWNGRMCAQMWLAPEPCADDKADCEKRCAIGMPHPCMLLGKMIPETENPDLKRRLFERGCEGGDAESCYALAWFFRMQDAHAPETPADFELYRKACEGGFAGGCIEEAAWTRRGVATPKDPAKARDLYARACDLGLPFGCASAGELYESGEAGPVDHAAAYRMFNRGCDGRETNACLGLASLLEQGKGLDKPDPIRAEALRTRACDDGQVRCLELGRLYEKGVFPQRGAADALRVFRTACDHNDGEACRLAAEMFEQARGASQDLVESARYYDRGCKRDDKTSCEQLKFRVILFRSFCEKPESSKKPDCGGYALLERDGVGVPRDVAAAMKLFDEECERRSSGAACRALGQIYEAGDDAPNDPKKALELYRKGCAKKDLASCESLESHAK